MGKDLYTYIYIYNMYICIYNNMYIYIQYVHLYKPNRIYSNIKFLPRSTYRCSNWDGLNHRCFDRCRTVAMRLELGFSPSFHRWLVEPRLRGWEGEISLRKWRIILRQMTTITIPTPGRVIFFWIRSGWKTNRSSFRSGWYRYPPWWPLPRMLGFLVTMTFSNDIFLRLSKIRT